MSEGTGDELMETLLVDGICVAVWAAVSALVIGACMRSSQISQRLGE